MIPSNYFIDKKKSKFRSKYPFAWLITLIIKIVEIKRKKIAWWSTKGVPEIVYANMEKQHVRKRDIVLLISKFKK